MFRQSSSTSGLCVALILSASLTVQSFPLTRSRIVFDVRANLNQPSGPQKPSASTADAQQKSAPKTDSQSGPAPAIGAPLITATLKDTGWPAYNGTEPNPPAATPGDTVTYTAIISNTGTADATGVTFNDIINGNTSTLVGTPTLSSVLVGDVYTSIGNVGINSANLTGCPTANTCHSVTGNDSLTGGEALSKYAAAQATLTSGGGTLINGSNTVTTTNNGTVLMNTDGTFTYNPAAGFTGTDSFFYAVNGPTGIATAQVTITVTTPIWFIDAAAGGTHVGTLANPFNCLTGGAGCFSNVNDGAAGHPKDNDNVFMYSGAYTGGLTPRNGQKLAGAGASASLATIFGITVPTESNTLPSTGGANPTVTTVAASTNGINLGVGFSNTLRGFTIGNTTGFKIASGVNFGTLTVSEVLLNSTGGDLSLTSGALAATFAGVTSTSSAAQGIALSSITGSLTTNGTTISGNTSQCILVSGSTVTADFGNTSCTGGTDGVSLQNNSSGTRTFGTLGVSGGSGNAFLHAAGSGGGNATITGAATLSSPGSAVSVSTPGATNVINFQAATSATATTAAATGVNWVGTAGAQLTFNSLTIQTNGGTGLNATTGGTVTVTNGTGTINNTTQAASAIIANGIALNANFSAIKSSGGTNGVSLTNVTGTSNFGTGAISGNSGDAFLVNGQNGTFTYNGTIASGSAHSVNVTGKNGGTVTFGGAVTDTDTGISLTSNTGATINFTGGISVSTGANTGFNATGGGTISATQNNTSIVNTLTTTTGTALNVANTTIGASGLTFRSISAGTGVDSAGNGIVLDTTGSSGGLTVTGNGSACTFSPPATCDGGTIQHKNGADNTANSNYTTGIGIYLNSTSTVSLTRMHLHDFSNYGIRGRTVSGFTLQTSVIDGANGDNATSDIDGVGTGGEGEGPIRFTNLTGSALIDSSFIGGGFANNVLVSNNTGTLDRLTISNSTIGKLGSNRGLAAQASGGNEDVFVESATGITKMNVTILNNILNYGVSRIADVTNNSQSTGSMDAVIRGNTMINSNPASGQVPGAAITNVSGVGPTTYDMSCNTIQNPAGPGLVVFKGKGDGSAVNFVGTIYNNKIGATGVVHSGGGGGADGISVDSQGSGTSTVLIKNNNVRRFGDAGIRVNNVDGNSTLNATLIGNTVLEPDSDAFTGLYVVAGADGTTDSGDTTNVLIGGSVAARNDFSDSSTGTNGVFLNHGAAGTGAMHLSKGVSGSSSSAQVVVDNNNVTLGNVATTDPGPPAIILVSSTPTLPPAINEACSPPPIANPGPDDIAEQTQLPNTTTAGSDPSASATALPWLRQVLNPVAAFAAKLNFLRGSEVPVTPIALVAENNDATKTNKAQQLVASAPVSQIAEIHNRRSERSSASTAATTLNHAQRSEVRGEGSEIGRSNAVKANHATRSRTTSDDKKITPASGGTVSFGPFGLSIGSSVTVMFQVTINFAQPLPHTSISNQGKVAGTNFALVNGASIANPNTDDPDNPGSAGNPNPTLTPLTGVSAANSTVSGRITDDAGNPVEGAVVRLNGTQDRKTITDAAGNYSFADVETNGFYTVTPSRVNYNFAPATRGFSALGAHTEASFGAAANGNHQNPLDTTEYFVRQQYVDFLGREPEEKGFNDWTDTINNCAAGDTSCDRVHVSEMFFRSEEFQQRGYFVYRFYSTAFGQKPDYAAFVPDLGRVSGFLDATQLEGAKTQFASDFVTRAAFVNQYGTLSNAQYVDALSQTSGVTLSNRQALVDSLEAGTLTRAQALRQIAESGEVYQRYYNQAFVVMEYFGYLRRDPDILYLNWISVLDANPADSRHMVEGFVDATEYRNRFKQ